MRARACVCERVRLPYDEEGCRGYITYHESHGIYEKSEVPWLSNTRALARARSSISKTSGTNEHTLEQSSRVSSLSSQACHLYHHKRVNLISVRVSTRSKHVSTTWNL